MKKWIFILAFVFSSTVLLAQRIEVFGGANRHHLRYPPADGQHYFPYSSGSRSYSFGIGVDFELLDTIILGVVVKMDNYSGKFHTSGGGNAANVSTDIQYEKSVVAIDFYPLNVMLFKNLRLGLGGEYHFVTMDKTTGSTVVDRLWSPYHSVFSVDQKTVGTKNGAGIVTRISYDIRFLKTWFIVPQYQFYYGLTNEFENIQAYKDKAYRHYLYLGIAKKF